MLEGLAEEREKGQSRPGRKFELSGDGKGWGQVSENAIGG